MPNDSPYRRNLVLALREYGLALKVNSNTNPEPYVTRFPKDKQPEVRRMLDEARQRYVKDEEMEDLFLIWESSDLSLSDKLIATFRGAEKYLPKIKEIRKGSRKRNKRR